MRSTNLLLLCCVLVAGCDAYAKAANSVLDNVNASSGSVKVVNTMAVSVCKVTMTNDQTPGRDKNDLGAKELPPGGEGSVDIPYVGKPSEQKPQPDTWTMQVYGCQPAAGGFAKEPGALLATIPNVKKDAPQVSIR